MADSTSVSHSGTEQRFSSRWALLISVLGIAVGTGNIWRFPRIVAQNGGEEGAGAFLVSWVIFLFAWSIPLIIAEYALGLKGRMSPVGTFAKIAGRGYTWMGAFVAFVAAAIMFYYSVVAGWCLYYFLQTAFSALPTDSAVAIASWEQFQSGWLPIGFHALMMGLGGWAISRGVSSIERISKVMIPTLLGVVLLCVIRAVTLPGAGEGLRYLFTPEWSLLGQPRIWLEALTQNAWDTGAGWGLILTYAAYMRPEHGVVRNAFATGIGNNTVSILAAIMVFSTVFSILGADLSRPEVLQIMRESGPASTGLTFIWMPQLFAKMAFGKPLAMLFFLGLSFAAFTSLVSMIELSTRVFVDGGIRRKNAIFLVSGIGFLLGIPSAMNLDVLGNQDFVWGVALMISGAFIAFAVLRAGIERFRQEIMQSSAEDWRLGSWWDVMLKFIVPLEAIVLLIWWMWLAATVYAPDDWYDPFNPYSVMTCLVQWGAALVVLLLLNQWMVKKTLRA